MKTYIYYCMCIELELSQNNICCMGYV